MAFTHLNKNNQPAMVGVGNKRVSKRKALARATVLLPPEVLVQFQEDDLQTKKGSVFQTANLAGIIATKKTWDLIPLCHQILLDKTNLEIKKEGNKIIIDCEVHCTGKTGVEMEALTGATIAALTIYDMCKALSHAIVIQQIELIEKSGGKSDYNKEPS